MKKLLLLAAAASLMTACAESSTAPTSSRKAANVRSSADEFCESGYLVAYNEMGEPYCAPASRAASQPMVAPAIKP